MNSHTGVLQYSSGNGAESFGMQQLAVAFLRSTPPEVILYRRNCALWNQSLTKCNFCKSFPLTSIQNARGYGGLVNFLAFGALRSQCFSLIFFVLIFLRTLLHFFAVPIKASLLFSSDYALCVKKNGCGVPVVRSSRRASRDLSAHGAIFLAGCRVFLAPI